MSYFHYFCLFAHSGVQYILCCVLFVFVFVPYVANFSRLYIYDRSFNFEKFITI
jgi:hypothetical protein